MKEIKVTKRGNRFGFYYRVPGYDHPFYESYETEAEAKARAAAVKWEKMQGTLKPPTAKQNNKTPTLAAFLSEYVEKYGRENWGSSQFSVVTRQIRDYILPAPISRLLITDIKPRDIDGFFQDLKDTPCVLRKGHRDTGKTVGKTVIAKIRCTLRSAFYQAIEWEYITTNPVCKKKAQRGKAPGADSRRASWKPQEAKLALESCDDENLHLCMMLAIVCSMRIGEILGLQWDSVDLTGEASLENSPSLTVKQELKRCDINSLEQTKNQTDPREIIYLEFPTRKKTGKAKTVLVLKSPKTNSSNRPLYFGPTMLEALKKHQELQNEEKRKSGEMYNDYDLVIAHPDGSPVEARFIEKKFNDLIEATGLPKVVFHSLRHLSTSLKLKYSGGDIKAVQGDTGHATAEMVTDVYGEINPEDQIALAGCFENNFFGKTSPKADETDTASSSVLASFRKLLAEKPDAAKTLIDLLEKML